MFGNKKGAETLETRIASLEQRVHRLEESNLGLMNLMMADAEGLERLSLIGAAFMAHMPENKALIEAYAAAKTHSKT